MAKLIFTGKKFADQVYELMLEKTSVGRGSGSTLQIHDSSVSVDHCEILVHGSEVIVRDHASTNGTFVNDVRITGQAPVKSGQIIRFGSVEARLELDPPTSTDLASDHTAVRAFSRAVRDQRRARSAPKPDAVIDPGASTPQTDHTVISPRPTPAPQPPQPVPAPSTPGAGRRSGWLVWTIVGLVIVLGLLALGYALWPAGR